MAQKVNANDINLGLGTTVVATSESTSSATYVALTTAQALTVTVGINGILLVILTARLNGAGGNFAFMGFNMSGANSFSADDTRSIVENQTVQVAKSGAWLLTGLIPGSTTLTAVFKSGSGSATFANRNIIAIPF